MGGRRARIGFAGVSVSPPPPAERKGTKCIRAPARRECSAQLYIRVARLPLRSFVLFSMVVLALVVVVLLYRKRVSAKV